MFAARVTVDPVGAVAACTWTISAVGSPRVPSIAYLPTVIPEMLSTVNVPLPEAESAVIETTICFSISDRFATNKFEFLISKIRSIILFRTNWLCCY